MTYVDGFVLVVKKKNISAYKKMAQLGGKLWKKHGALEYLECVGDDLKPNMGMGPMKILTFPKMTKTKSDETVVFSFITYKSRKHRDEVNKKVMSDPSMNDPKNKNMKMPFDMKKMAYGGFNAIVEF
ncbi:MAG: DUF1428 domain-containing protein [Candidatus Woesearchaeota archaeon]